MGGGYFMLATTHPEFSLQKGTQKSADSQATRKGFHNSLGLLPITPILPDPVLVNKGAVGFLGDWPWLRGPPGPWAWGYGSWGQAPFNPLKGWEPNKGGVEVRVWFGRNISRKKGPQGQVGETTGPLPRGLIGAREKVLSQR